MRFFHRLTGRGMTGALFRYQLMANIVGVLIIPLFLFTGLHFASGKNSFKAELAIFGVAHGYLYIVYLVTAGFLAVKARLHIPWILLMFAAGLVPGLTFVVEWLVVTRKIQPLLAERAAPGSGDGAGSSSAPTIGSPTTSPPSSGQSSGTDSTGVSPAAR
jgi:integral membrane protein